MRFRQKIIVLLATTLVTVFSAAGLSAGVVARSRGVCVGMAPPPLLVEEVGAAPGFGYVWIAGHHAWHGDAYVWVPGRWQLRPYEKARWVPGSWRHDESGWYWIEGRWM